MFEMARLRSALQAGHWPTLLAAFLYFDFCFAIWVLNGAMAPFISESFALTPAQKGFMVSVPILAGALIRFPLGVLAQYVGRKNAAMVEMGLIVLALAYGSAFVDSYSQVIAMGVLLGIAGASFGVALSLGGGWYPSHLKGLAMGVAGAGNSGTVLAVLFAPPLAAKFGWQAVYGLAAGTMLLPMVVMWLIAKEPPDRVHQPLRAHLSCLFEKDGWIFSAIYIVTAGGFIGVASFLPTYFHDQFQVTKVEAGQLTMLATLMSAVARVLGGQFSDRVGGINVLSGVLLLVSATLLLCGLASASLVVTTLLLMLYFILLGAGSGALFQLVPLRWPTTTAVVVSMIGEIGAFGGGFIPTAMGQSKQATGTYLWGFVGFAVVPAAMLLLLRLVQRRWTTTWVGRGGRSLALAEGIAHDGDMPAQVLRRVA
jgi:NNP family nitrate/nitrite transporter-like MFS transporter